MSSGPIVHSVVSNGSGGYNSQTNIVGISNIQGPTGPSGPVLNVVGALTVNGVPLGGGSTGAVSFWATYPAVQNVDMSQHDITNVSNIQGNGGVLNVAGFLTLNGTPVSGNASAWATYPAVQDVNMSQKNITNVATIQGVAGATGPAILNVLGSLNVNNTPTYGNPTMWSNYAASQNIDLSKNGIQNVGTIQGVTGATGPAVLNVLGSLNVNTITNVGTIQGATGPTGPVLNVLGSLNVNTITNVGTIQGATGVTGATGPVLNVVGSLTVNGAPVAGTSSTWATYPAVQNVNMNSHYIYGATEVHTNTVYTDVIRHGSQPSTTLQNSTVYDPDILNVPGGFQDGYGMDMTHQDNNYLNTYVADITSGAPQVDFFNTSGLGVFQGFSGFISQGSQQDLYNGVYNPIFSQTDISQQKFRITIVYQLNITSGTPTAFGLYPSVTFFGNGFSTNGSLYDGGGAYKFDRTTNYYDDGTNVHISSSITDIIDFQGSLYYINGSGSEVPLGLDLNQDISFNLNLIPLENSMHVNTSLLMLFVEPILYAPYY